ncbi:hypothetical protein [Piscinibacter sp.]|jgi:tetratricopeptide (TPR) repeat protein|uniref:hypothetical protein n=1 Tax=Piscinibacter sp. TaxID=1903157 RepID=UPI00355A6E55
MTTPKSRALTRLDAAIAAAGSPVAAACLKAERAGLLARLGRFDEVRRTLDELRAQHANTPSPALAAWLCLAEGLMDHYRDQAASARDRIQRAYAFSTAARERPLIAVCAAWLAHFDYVYDDLGGVARHVAEALQEAADDHHAARARACLVAAQSYHWGGRSERAQPWYQRAREHATADGDATTIGALMINRAWISGNQARMASIFGPDAAAPNPNAVREALVGAESAGHFDAYVGRNALRSMARVMRAQLVLAQGDYAEALALFDAHLPGAVDDGLSYMLPVLHADIAWCKFKLGCADDALAEARLAQASFGPDCEEEDSAAANGRLAQVFSALGLDAEAKPHAERAAAELKTLREQQALLVSLLDAALRQVPGLQ